MVKRIVILGHTGFIGKHLEFALRKNYPAIEIMGFSRSTLDLTRDVSLLKKHCDQNTAIIMCAAVKKQFGDSLEHCEKNIAMAINLSKMLEKHPVPRLIYLSSAEVYGHHEHFQNQPITEETLAQPTSYYGIAKYAAERMLQKVIPQSLVILRPPQIYGFGDVPCYGPSGFLQAASDGKEINLWGDGDEKREFIFVDDVISLIRQFIFSSYSGIVNVASGVSYSYQEIIEILKKELQVAVVATSKPRTQPKADFYFSNQKIKDIFPQFQFTPLPEGIRKMNSHTISGKVR